MPRERSDRETENTARHTKNEQKNEQNYAKENYAKENYEGKLREQFFVDRSQQIAMLAKAGGGWSS